MPQRQDAVVTHRATESSEFPDSLRVYHSRSGFSSPAKPAPVPPCPHLDSGHGSPLSFIHTCRASACDSTLRRAR